MTATAPVILWLRRDLRLEDHAALTAAVAQGGPVIPVYIRDGLVDDLGAAPAWRLGLALRTLAQALDSRGSRLIFRSGPAQETLRTLVAQTGARSVYWSRCYDPAQMARDIEVKKSLKDQGIAAKSYSGHLLFEPQDVQTGAGGSYRVFTPFWKTVRGRAVPCPTAAPARIPPPHTWPDSEDPSGWHLGAGLRRGAAVLALHARPGAAAAQARLAAFLAEDIAQYQLRRDLPGVRGTSGMSEYLALGEISPRTCWQGGLRMMQDGIYGAAGAETFLKELAWREFAYHLAYHSPHLLTRNWKPGWDAFPWQRNPDHPHVIAWKMGRTGVPFVDAAMREMYVTGRMHNRGRMIVASYLTKHLMTDWRIGQAWFADCLTDWDPASNAMGWQWAAGSGPDAAPYFRVFNPVTQLAKFDPQGLYARQWIAEGAHPPSATALSYFDAIPRRWPIRPDDPYPAPIVSAEQGRKIALEAYQNRDF